MKGGACLLFKRREKVKLGFRFEFSNDLESFVSLWLLKIGRQ